MKELKIEIKEIKQKIRRYKHNIKLRNSDMETIAINIVENIKTLNSKRKELYREYGKKYPKLRSLFHLLSGVSEMTSSIDSDKNEWIGWAAGGGQ